MNVDQKENCEKEGHCHIQKMNFHTSKNCTPWDLKHLVQEKAVKHPKSNKSSGLTPLSWIDKKDIQNNERSDGKVTSRKTENHLLQEKMKGSSYLETSMKIQKYRATVLQLLDMHNLKRELITCHVRQTCDVHKPWYRQEASTVELMMAAKFLLRRTATLVSYKKMKRSTGICFLCIFVFFFLFYSFIFIFYFFILVAACYFVSGLKFLLIKFMIKLSLDKIMV